MVKMPRWTNCGSKRRKDREAFQGFPKKNNWKIIRLKCPKCGTILPANYESFGTYWFFCLDKCGFQAWYKRITQEWIEA